VIRSGSSHAVAKRTTHASNQGVLSWQAERPDVTHRFPRDYVVAKVDDPQALGGKTTTPGKATDTCKFGIVYDEETNPPCRGVEQCGAVLHYRVARVTKEGEDCPKSFAGMRTSEKVSSDHGCIKEDFNTGAGCPINADGTLSGCEDTYALCLKPERFPKDGCTETATQRLFVGGHLAEKRKVVWTIHKDGVCSGKVNWKTA
jgi:hypothetical protein